MLHILFDFYLLLLSILCVCVCVCMRACMHVCAHHCDSVGFGSRLQQNIDDVCVSLLCRLVEGCVSALEEKDTTPDYYLITNVRPD